MSSSERVLEDPLAIRMLFQRLLAASDRVTLAYRTERQALPLLALEGEMLALGMERADFEGWKLVQGEKVSLNVKDRGMKYEAVVACEGLGRVEDLSVCHLQLPRSLRRADAHRLVDFVPDQELPRATFSNARSALVDGQVTGFSREGLEFALTDPRQKIGDFFRLGEESTVDLPLEGSNVRLVAPARVAYLDDRVVGLQFTEKADSELLGSYRTWLEDQERLQAQRDREDFELGGRRAARRAVSELPGPRVLVDRDPMVAVLTESEEFARRMAEGLGRKFGFLSLDYIKGPVRPLLKEWGVTDKGWGRIRLIVIHNRLRLASPLELCRELTELEKCDLPILVAGGEEDLDLKRVRALEAGAVDYIAVEPFKILTVLKKLDDVIRMFEG